MYTSDWNERLGFYKAKFFVNSADISDEVYNWILIPIIVGCSSSPSSLPPQLIKSDVDAVALLSLLSWLRYVEMVSKLGLRPDFVLLLSTSSNVFLSFVYTGIVVVDLWPKSDR